jgi:hypothetical protein
MDKNRFKRRTDYAIPKRPAQTVDASSEVRQPPISPVIPRSPVVLPIVQPKSEPRQPPIPNNSTTPVSQNPPSPAQNVQVNLTIALPSLARLRKIRVVRWLSKPEHRARVERLWELPIQVATITVVALAIVGFSVLSIVNHRHASSTSSFGNGSIPAKNTGISSTSLGIKPAASNNPVTSSKLPVSNTTATTAEPTSLNFTPLVPNGEPQLAKLGSSAFSKSEDSYTFNDLFLAEPLQISEQPVPAGYSSSDALLAAVASKLGVATTSFLTNKGPGIITTNSSTNQTVVLVTSNLLVFSKTSYVHSIVQWQSYFNDLQ